MQLAEKSTGGLPRLPVDEYVLQYIVKVSKERHVSEYLISINLVRSSLLLRLMAEAWISKCNMEELFLG